MERIRIQFNDMIHNIKCLSRLCFHHTNHKNLSTCEIEVLTCIYFSKQLLTPMDIVEITNMQKMNVSKILKQLADKGYIEKQVNKKDHRSFLISMHPEGLKALKKQHRESLYPIEQLYEKMGKESFEQLHDLLQQATLILQHLEEGDHNYEHVSINSIKYQRFKK